MTAGGVSTASPDASMGWASNIEPVAERQPFLWPGTMGTRAGSASTRRPAPVSRCWPRQVESALVEIGVPASIASEAARRRPSNFSEDRKAFVMTIETDLYVFDLATGKASRLTRSAESKSEMTFSPDGRTVAYVRSNDLHVARRMSLRFWRACERVSLGAGIDERRKRQAAQRQARLGLLRGVVWTRHTPRVLVEPGLIAHRLHPARRDERAGIHAARRHLLSPGSRRAGTIRRPAIRIRPRGSACRRRNRRSRSAGSTRSKYSDFLIVNVGWTPDGRRRRLSDPEPRTDVARLEPRRPCDRQR